MSREPQREWLSSQDDGAMSEANSSVQVHLDSSSVRNLSTSRTQRSRSRHRSLSRNPDHASTRQPAANSQSQSSGSSSVPENLPAEDVLIDLITVTDTGRNSAEDLLHGQKRPHDGDLTGEPSPKRDKLGEELEQMMAEAQNENRPTPGANNLPAPSPTLTPNPSSEVSPAPSTGKRKVLPMRHARKPSTQGTRQENEQVGPSNPASSHSDEDSRSRGRHDTRPS